MSSQSEADQPLFSEDTQVPLCRATVVMVVGAVKWMLPPIIEMTMENILECGGQGQKCFMYFLKKTGLMYKIYPVS